MRSKKEEEREKEQTRARGDTKTKETKDLWCSGIQIVMRGYGAYFGEFLVSWALLKIYDF